MSNSDRFVGIDFGTTNSTLATSDSAGNVELLRYAVNGKDYDTFRSVIHFDAERKAKDNGPLATAGMDGIHAYLSSGGHGRFVQSVKSYLASRTFKSTNIYFRVFTLEQLITIIVSQLKAKAASDAKRVVVGRPVHFVNDEDDVEGDAYAESRLKQAILAAGFEEVAFAYEPVAAAYQYESSLDHDELVLIADFGGGTTDLCLVDVGPKARQQKNRAIRATDGVALAGDTFDQRIIQHAVAPRLGLGTKYRVFGGDADVPKALYASLARWHLLSFMKAPKTLQLLDTLVANAYDKHALATLRRIVDDDLGYELHQAVERTKIALSTAEEAHLDFDSGTLSVTVKREDFNTWISPDLARMNDAIVRVLKSANVDPGHVDRVFMTGGTSLVPAVRTLFASHFGADKLAGGQEMTSVGRGLALVARDLFQ